MFGFAEYWLVSILASVLLVLLMLKLLIWYRSGWCSSAASMAGKVVIVTGASAGIGKETARDLARRGARVIMACRNLKKAENVAETIKKDTGSNLVDVLHLDTSSLTSVRNFVNSFIKISKRLDVLILNAGIAGQSSLTYTEDGLELTMATNHFGHFLLVNLLLGILKASAPSRVVVVASIMHSFVSNLDVQRLNFPDEKDFGNIASYSRSKLCNVLTALHLSHLMQGTGVAVNSLCPGFVCTDIRKESDWFVHKLERVIALTIAKSEIRGAQTTIHLAVSEEAANVTGEYFEDCKISTSSVLGSDRGLAKKVWERSEELVKLDDHEKHYSSE